jgi:AcrR family transcriptional regulator
MARAGLDAESVVDAATALADADGLDRLTLAGLAGRLGVRTPSLYGHVGGLADLRARLAARGAALLRERLADAAAGRAGADALRATADAYRRFVDEHPGLYAATQGAPTFGDPEVTAAASAVTEVMSAVMRGYGLEGEDAVHAVRVVRSAIHGFVSIDAVGGFGIPVSLDETWERLIAMLDRTLAAGAPGS